MIDRHPNGRSMNVSFSRLSIVEAQSIQITYSVVYSLVEPVKRQSTENSVAVPDNQQYVIIENLDPSAAYNVMVVATNSEGSNSSSTLTVYPGTTVNPEASIYIHGSLGPCKLCLSLMLVFVLRLCWSS